MIEKIILNGQFTCRKSSVSLPVSVGENVYYIEVLKGKVQLNHGSFTPDGGTWLCSPTNGEPAHYKLGTGTHIIKLNAAQNDNRLDKVNIVNPLFFHRVAFTISFNE